MRFAPPRKHPRRRRFSNLHRKKKDDGTGTTNSASGSTRIGVNRMHDIHPIFVQHLNSHNKTGIQLSHFRPKKPPYIPILLQVLVNYVEKFGANWEYLYVTDHGSRMRASRLLDFLVCLDERDADVMVNAMQAATLAEASIAIKMFLGEMARKPLAMSADFLREDEEEDGEDGSSLQHRSIMRMLDESCGSDVTSLHTLCFIMIHLLHTWEYSANALTCRQVLADTFGSLIFEPIGENDEEREEESEKRRQKRRRPKSGENPGRYFEVLLNRYTNVDWYLISQCPYSLRRAFLHVTPSEIRLFRLPQYSRQFTLCTPSINVPLFPDNNR